LDFEGLMNLKGLIVGWIKDILKILKYKDFREKWIFYENLAGSGRLFGLL